MTKIRGHFRKEKLEKKGMAEEREMVDDAVSEKEIERVSRKEKKELGK